MSIITFFKSFFGQKQIPNQNAPTSAISTPSQKVLVVEDDPALRSLYVDILTTEGFTVLQAENGQIGLDAIKSQKPGLVLLDLMMPVMDGKTMLHTLRQIPEFIKLPVIILTNAGDIESMRETKFYDNANEFLIKSNVTPQDIINRVRTLMPPNIS